MKSNPKIAIIRGSYANPYELQNYRSLATLFPINLITTKHTIEKVSFLNIVECVSLADFPITRVGKTIARRVIGGDQYLFEFNKAVKDADILHVADPYYPYAFQAIKTGKPVIVTYWETQPFRNESIEIMKKHKYAVLNKAAHIMCYTKRAAQAVVQEGFSGNRITIVNPSVDTSLFIPNYKPGKTVLFAGRPVEEKGIRYLYDAFKLVREIIPDAKLQITGIGKKYSYNEMPTVYHNTSILVLPSITTKTWEEQLGMVLIEAMACGLPIITTDCGAIPEVVGNVAVIVEQRNSVELASAICRLLSSPRLQIKHGKMSLERFRMYFSQEIFSKTVKKMYEKVYRDYSH